MNNEAFQQLKNLISEKCYATKNDHRILSESGTELNWIFDFRSILLTPTGLDLVAELFWEQFENKYPFQVGGLEVAAVPLISAIVMKSVQKGMPVNGFFIRKSRKKTGLLNMIEGEMTDAPIILVDDLINSGKTFLRQLAVTDKLQKRVSNIFVILSFRSPEYFTFAHDREIALTSLYSLPDFGQTFIVTKQKMSPRPTLRTAWHFKSPGANLFYVVPKSAPTINADHVFFGSDNGNFWALNQTDGSVVWKYKVGWHPKGKAIFSTPIIHNDSVYFGSYDGSVYALDTQTGKRKWMFTEADWIGSSPAISVRHNLLFIGLEFGLWKKSGGIVALDLSTGEKRWEYYMPHHTHCSPTYDEERNLVATGSNDGVAYVFNAKNGKLLWQYKTDGEIKGAPSFDTVRGYVLFASFDGGLYIFDSLSGKLLHVFSAEYGFYSIPLVHKNHVYVTSFDKKMYAINLDTFSIDWEFTARGRIFASPVMINDHILIGTNDARLYEIDAKTGDELSFFQVTERITNRIAYNPDTKRIFLPTFANELYCLEQIPKEF